jgi:hypothetical protein
LLCECWATRLSSPNIRCITLRLTSGSCCITALIFSRLSSGVCDAVLACVVSLVVSCACRWPCQEQMSPRLAPWGGG